MQLPPIDLEDSQMHALELLATEENRSVNQMVREAIDLYLRNRLGVNERWQERFEQMVDKIQQRVPDTVTPDEIEADITDARAEVRQARNDARRY